MSDTDSGPESARWAVDPQEVVVDKLIGSGATAEVYVGRFRGKDVAIKRLTSTKKKAFIREIQILQNVVHENLVQMVALTNHSAGMQIVMEFCDGGSVFDLLHGEHSFQLSWHQNIKIGLDIGSAICYLHDFKPLIIHRDLKSSNILLAKRVTHRADTPRIKVADFGLACVVEHEQRKNAMTMDVGTFHWMAPEVLLGNSYDEKVDVYSFAMVLYELICRDIPFSELEAADAACTAVKGGRPSLSNIGDGCPEKLKMLMTTCWNQEASRRPSFTNVLKWLNMVAAELGFNPEQPSRVVQL